jgi:ABC-2 type transport system ATP-binding protein
LGLRAQIRKLNSDGTTILLTTHYLEEAEHLANVIGVLHKGKVVGLGSLDQLRSEVGYQYSIMVASAKEIPPVPDGLVTRGRSGQTQILTNEDEAHTISRQLLEDGSKFSMSRISLDDIFFRLVNKSEAEVVAR